MQRTLGWRDMTGGRDIFFEHVDDHGRIRGNDGSIDTSQRTEVPKEGLRLSRLLHH